MRILLAFFILVGAVNAAWAQSWPSRPVRLVIPFSPGGGADIAGRVIGQELSDVLKQPVMIENRAGAGGTIAPNNVAKSPADGYSLVLGHLGGIAIAPHLYKDLSFDPINDLASVTLVVNGLSVLVVNPDLPVKTVGELVAHAKANPSQLSFSSAGSGTDTHLAGELFKSMTGTAMVHVPYKGGAPAMVDLLAGRVQLSFASVATTISSIQTGKLRAVAMTGSTVSRVCRVFRPSRSRAFPVTRSTTGTEFSCPQIRRRTSSSGSTPRPSRSCRSPRFAPS